jgi:LysM repeat protein
LSDIAEYCDTTVLALMQANNVRNPHNLRVGQTLTVPAVRGNVYDGTRFASIPRQPVYTDYRTQAPAPAGGDVYIVRRGDTMSEIANIYGVSTARLARLNRHLNPSSLRPGDRVILPANVDTPYYAERRDPAPLNPPIRSSHTNSAPVVIYIGDDPAGRAGTYAQEGKAVIVVDSDNRRAAPARDRIRTTRYVPNTVDRHTVIEQPAIPSGTVLTLRTKLPETQSSQYADLGTACMRFRDGQREVYRVQVTAAGPECGSDRPVRLYKPGL